MKIIRTELYKRLKKGDLISFVDYEASGESLHIDNIIYLTKKPTIKENNIIVSGYIFFFSEILFDKFSELGYGPLLELPYLAQQTDKELTIKLPAQEVAAFIIWDVPFTYKIKGIKEMFEWEH